MVQILLLQFIIHPIFSQHWPTSSLNMESLPKPTLYLFNFLCSISSLLLFQDTVSPCKSACFIWFEGVLRFQFLNRQKKQFVCFTQRTFSSILLLRDLFCNLDLSIIGFKKQVFFCEYHMNLQLTTECFIFLKDFRITPN